MDISIAETETEAKIVPESDQARQARLTEDNSAVMKNFAEATNVLSIVSKEDLAQVIELNKLTGQIEPLGLLDL